MKICFSSSLKMQAGVRILVFNRNPAWETVGIQNTAPEIPTPLPGNASGFVPFQKGWC